MIFDGVFWCDGCRFVVCVWVYCCVGVVVRYIFGRIVLVVKFGVFIFDCVGLMVVYDVVFLEVVWVRFDKLCVGFEVIWCVVVFVVIDYGVCFVED